jgi:hypothetical protein
MALSTPEFSRSRPNHKICPHCGRSANSPGPAMLETGLSVLAGLVLIMMLAPLAVIAWKSCSDFLSDKASHSIFYHPPEDWTRY